VKAVRIHRFGGPEEFRLEEIELPAPGPGQVQVRLQACALNHLDVDVVRGVSRFPVEMPFVPGLEVVGEIVDVGPEVNGWAVGDRVAPKVMENCGRCQYCQTGRQSLCHTPNWISFAYSGGYSEGLVCAADQLVRVPDELSDEEAAAVQVAFATAWHMLFTRGRLQAGETVLVNAVGSGIGSAAVQLAHWAGARVIGTAGSESKLQRAKELGLDDGLDYREDPHFSEGVRALTGGHGADLVFEHVGGDVFTESLAALAKGGRLVTCGGHAGEVVPFDIIPFFRAEKEIIGSFVFVEREVTQVFELARRGVIRPVVDSVFSLEEAAQAMARMESRDAFGKIILRSSHA
jgi:2-desacetyl-2-hydroxyethyl bacteriochlorophyllide A dehydrogenase